MNIKNLTDKMMHLKDFRPSYKQKKIASFAALLIAISSPLAFAKNETKKVVAENVTPTVVQSQTPAPTPEPTQTQTPETQKSATNEPVKTPIKSKMVTKSSNLSTANQPESVTPSKNQTSNAPSQENTSSSKPVASGILGFINQAREENGLATLTYNSQLNSASKAKSQDMFDNNYFAHTSPDGRSDFDFIKATGYMYKFAGSNIAKGSFTEKSVFDAWMNSAGHRANILDPRAREFGYGVVGEYFTMMVGAR